MGSPEAKVILAKAIFDNDAESMDEVGFRKGDVLTVLEQDTGGLEGWWLVSLRGKQGIAPGNRLKIMRGSSSPYGSAGSTSNTSMNRVVVPKRVGDTFMPGPTQDYDVPPSRSHNSSFNQSFNHSFEDGIPSYDTPPSARDHRSLHVSQTYDTPPSALNHSNQSIQNRSLPLTPNDGVNSIQNRALPRTPMDTYDVPPSALNSSVDVYDVPSSASNRSSVLSNLSHLSNESTMNYSSGSFSSGKGAGKNNGGNNSHPASQCDSARSSMDISPHDFYDVPPCAQEVRTITHSKQLSADSGLDMYDSPPKTTKAPVLLEDEIQHDYDVLQSDYDTPKPATEAAIKVPPHSKSLNSKSLSSSAVSKQKVGKCSFDDIDGVPATMKPIVNSTKKSTEVVSKKNSLEPSTESVLDCYKDEKNPYDQADGRESREHDIDDIYDTPSSNAPVPSKMVLRKKPEEKPSVMRNINDKPKHESGAVYDIPPQVTRDSMFSSKSDSSEGSDDKRLSICSTGSDIPEYDELPLDLDAAMDLMMKLQQDVQKSTSSLLHYISSTWRQKKNLEANIYGIKEACKNIRSSLNEFLEFSEGTLGNSQKNVPDKKLIGKLYRQLSPLQNTLFKIKMWERNLDDMNWQVAKLETNDVSVRDDLGMLAEVSSELTIDVKKLTSLIHGNSSLLFHRSADQSFHGKSTDSKQKNSPEIVDIKPPIKGKPQLPPKPSAVSGAKAGTFQSRPLPSVPVQERPLPPTPDVKNIAAHDNSKRKSADFSRNSGDFSKFNEEFKRLSMELKEPSNSGKKMCKNLVDEYDYVHLEARDIELQKKNQAKMAAAEVDELPVRDSDPVSDDGSCDTLKRNSNYSEINSPSSVNGMNLKNTEFSSSPGIVTLQPSDKQVLHYYYDQLKTHTSLLKNSIGAFFECIECGQGPKDFISHSKFVVISAHKLVYVSDSLSKNLLDGEIKNRVTQCADHLCTALKLAVTATKTAALQYPSVPAVQDMVDRITDVAHVSHELKLVVTQAAQL